MSAALNTPASVGAVPCLRRRAWLLCRLPADSRRRCGRSHAARAAARRFCRGLPGSLCAPLGSAHAGCHALARRQRMSTRHPGHPERGARTRQARRWRCGAARRRTRAAARPRPPTWTASFWARRRTGCARTCACRPCPGLCRRRRRPASARPPAAARAAAPYPSCHLYRTSRQQ